MNRALEEFVQSHPLHAPDISLDLAQVIGGLRPVPDGRDRSGVALVKEHGLNIVLTVMNPACTTSKHTNRSPISIQVLEGEVRLDVHGHAKRMTSGELAIVDAHVEHGIIAETDSAILMTIAMTSG